MCPLYHTAKKDLGSPNEEWGVDQQLISKLKEEYKKERKGKKSSKYGTKVSNICRLVKMLEKGLLTI